MTHTPNYNLSQWEKPDRILMDDFNADNAKLDAALAAHDDALAKLGNCRVEVIRYTGTGTCGDSHPTTVTFSGKPAVIFIMGMDSFTACAYGEVYGPLAMYRNSSSIGTLTFTWSGNRVSYVHNIPHSQMNVEGRRYQVIAFYAEDEAE